MSIIPSTDLPKQMNQNYSLRFICYALSFIFLTEVILAYCIYRFNNTDVGDNILTEENFEKYFLNRLENEHYLREIRKIIGEFESVNDNGKNITENKDIGSNVREKRYARLGDNDDDEEWIWVTNTSKILVSKKTIISNTFHFLP